MSIAKFIRGISKSKYRDVCNKRIEYADARAKEAEQYLEMKVKETAGACCKNCISMKLLQFTTWCKLKEKRVSYGNICIHHKWAKNPQKESI